MIILRIVDTFGGMRGAFCIGSGVPPSASGRGGLRAKTATGELPPEYPTLRKKGSFEMSESQREFVVDEVYNLLRCLDRETLSERWYSDLADEWLSILEELKEPEDIKGSDERMAKEMLADYLFG